MHQWVLGAARHAAPLAPATALSILLTTEGLLFAVLGLAANLSGPANRVRRWLLPAPVLAAIAVAALTAVGTGAGFAWAKLYVGHFPSDTPGTVIAWTLFAAIALQPVLAVFLLSGLRKAR